MKYSDAQALLSGEEEPNSSDAPIPPPLRGGGMGAEPADSK